MGKVTELLAKVREMSDTLLVQRFKHISNIQAIKLYLASKPDKILDMEVRFCEEEIIRRLSEKNAMVQVITPQ